MIENSKISAIGLSTIVVGILLNPLFLGFVFSPTGRIVSVPHILLVAIIEIFVITAGVWTYMNRDRLTRRDLVLRGMVLCLVLLSTEAGLHVARYVRNYFRGTTIDNRMSLSIYRDAPWAEQLFKELHETSLDVDQYLGWKTAEYHGIYMNVDSLGVRKTTAWRERRSGPADSVFVFGGSNIWGMYVRDEGTVPSQLSRLLNEQGRAASVNNYGEQAYSFTQELLRLILQLRDGHRPTVVVFCNGFNDIACAQHYGRAGRIALYGELKASVETKRAPFRKQLAILTLDFLKNNSMLYKSIDRLAVLLFKGKEELQYDHRQIEEISAGVVREYVASFNILDSLSGIYGFRYLCFLQPILFTKTSVTEEERTADVQFNDPVLRELCLSTYASLEHLNLPNWFSLAHVFDGHEGTYFSDLCHPSEAGNQLIAIDIMKKTFGWKPPQ